MESNTPPPTGEPSSTNPPTPPIQVVLLPPKQSPPYLLGILCLIPLVGALVGFGLLLYGIIKYKDKWLIAIGAFGIAWTIFIYGFLFSMLFNNAAFRNGFADITQKNLNSLIPSIEYYKLKNGHYPDSLQQVHSVDQLVMIHDPLQFSMKKRPAGSDYYNYKHIGDKYYLFSSGKDGIPYTKDDLFPQVDSLENSKIGLIRPPAYPQ
jgi:hypothetical protein